MHYYQFNIGDYHSHTMHLEPFEDLAYRRLLDWYYLHEKPVPLDIEDIAKNIRMRSHNDCIAYVLRQFFVETKDGWIHHRCDAEIAKTGDKSRKASESARVRWTKQRDANALRTDCESNATHNTLHITHNTVVDSATDVAPTARKKGSRLDQNWVLPALWREWACRVRPTLNVDETADSFKDFWHSKAGKDACKLDWYATWRNWVRNQKIVRPSMADVVTMTVPSRQERDPSLVKIDKDRENWSPPSPEIKARMLAITASGANAKPQIITKGNL